MNRDQPLADEKKLTVLFRVEPGSLGPDGSEQAQQFCQRSQQQLAPIDADFIHWQIVPRFDKSLPELEYTISNKRLSRAQAQQYLKLLTQDLDTVEDHLINEIDRLIGEHQTMMNAG